MLCEIINPSDLYTLRTDNFQAAAIAIAVLGRGQLGLRTLDDELQTPVLFGWGEWLEAQGIEDQAAYVEQHWEAMADALDSVLIGSASYREDVESMLRRLPEEERRPWREERHDRHRSSMNDIGQAAWNLADRLREKYGAKEESA